MQKIAYYAKLFIFTKTLRTIHNTKFNSHSDPLFKQSGIFKIFDLYQIEVMTFMHDRANEKLPVSFKDVCNMNYNIHGIYETRQAHLLQIRRTKSRFVDILPLYQFSEIWNNWHNQLNVYTSRSGLRQTHYAKLLT